MNKIQLFGALQIVFAFMITIPFAEKIGDIILSLVWLTNLVSGCGFILIGQKILAFENIVKNEVRGISRQERND